MTARASAAEGGQVLFWCPGCDKAHVIRHEGPGAWSWTGDLERPTFSPSVLVCGTQWAAGEAFHKPTHAAVPAGGTIRCHSYVTDGQIQFLADSTHALAGRTVDLPEWPHA